MCAWAQRFLERGRRPKRTGRGGQGRAEAISSGSRDFLSSVPSCPNHSVLVWDPADGVPFTVKVQPRAPKNAIIGEIGDALKVALTAPPIVGRANAACREFFANLSEVPRSSVTIAAGQSSRGKVMRIRALSVAEVSRPLQF